MAVKFRSVSQGNDHQVALQTTAPSRYQANNNGSERRDSTRYPTSWVGHVPNVKAEIHVVDVSEGGLFLAMQPAPPLGTNLIIELLIAGTSLLVTGEVVRLVNAPPGAPMPSGVGLRLTRKPEGWQTLIRQLNDG